MKGQQDVFRSYLVERLEYFKGRNPSFSLRAMARICKINPAALSQFINSKRNFSSEMIFTIATNLALRPDQLIRLRELEQTNLPQNTKFSRKDMRERVQISLDNYYLVADWHYYAILCLAEMPDFKSDHAWIADRLATKVNHVEVVLERLARLGLLIPDKEGNLILRQVVLETTEDIPDTSIKKRHEENFDAAKTALYEIDVDQRDYSFSTIAINPDQIPQAKKMIREFRDKLIRCLEAGDKKEVYEICFQFFPRTDISKNDPDSP
jgi:uncharacterized protein (TIGR02147 family)